MLPLLTAFFFAAAACTSRNDANRTDNNGGTSNDNQAGNDRSATYHSDTSNQAYNSSNATSQNQQGQSGNDHNRDNASMNNQNQNNMSVNIEKVDRNFAMEAYKGGRMEIKMANEALDKADNVRVKDFAQMMVRDHTKANNELETILGRKNLMTDAEKESNDMTDMRDKMSGKKGRDFDIAYMRMMVNDHNEDVDLFRKESTEGKDSDLREFAQKVLPIIRTHLDSAKAIYGSLSGSATTRH